MVVAIIGGTLLTVALTRPRPDWLSELTAERPASRRWVERGLTIFAFVIGGYAYGSLYSVLSGHLSRGVVELLIGAGVFLGIYGWLIHLEPFLEEWQLRGGLAAGALYTGVAVAALLLGATVEDSVLFGPRGGDLLLVVLAAASLLYGYILFRMSAKDRSSSSTAS